MSLRFTTSGLRAPIGEGVDCVNIGTLRQAAWAVGQFVTEHLTPEQVTVVIGYDARHLSYELAQDSARTYLAAGFQVKLLSEVVETGLLAYAVSELEAEIGIMVTASHNPATDNGYKVYAGGKLAQQLGDLNGIGAQIVAPHDEVINQLITSAPEPNEIPQVADLPTNSATFEQIEKALRLKYIRLSHHRILSALPAISPTSSYNSPLSIALTALHGVGGTDLVGMLQVQSFNDLRIVEEQQSPDPDFPTVKYPNPEEPQAMEMVLQLAKRNQSDLVLALDPDADRLGVGCYDKHIKNYRNLTGDEIGTIFTHHFLNHHRSDDYWDDYWKVRDENGIQKTTEVKIASSFTSTQLVPKMCDKHSIPHITTNAGTKNIVRVPNLLFGYEESLGYIVLPEYIRDKDGLLAAVLMANIARNLKSSGRTLIDLLDEIALEHGLYLQKLVTKRFATAKEVESLNNRLVQQYGFVVQTSNKFNATEYRNGGTRIITRQSGTEPKVKYYIEVEQTCEDGCDIELLRKRGSERLEEVANYLSD